MVVDSSQGRRSVLLAWVVMKALLWWSGIRGSLTLFWSLWKSCVCALSRSVVSSSLCESHMHVIFRVLALQILTRDSVTTQVDGVVYYRIYSAVSAVANVNDVHQATFLLAQTTLRNVLGTQTLSQILAGREEIAHSIQVKTLRTNSLRC